MLLFSVCICYYVVLSIPAYDEMGVWIITSVIGLELL